MGAMSFVRRLHCQETLLLLWVSAPHFLLSQACSHPILCSSHWEERTKACIWESGGPKGRQETPAPLTQCGCYLLQWFSRALKPLVCPKV